MADIEDKEVSWKVLDISVNGTITAPADNGPHPAIIFVAGSGPTDRNWCSPLLPGTNGSAKLLAEALAKQGFVTLRYDKVASGPHVRENFPKFSGKLSMQTHMQELGGGVETLVSEISVDTKNLFVLTNSEGSIHAVNYQLQATKHRFKGLVLTGAPGRTIGAVSHSQIADQAKALPNAEALMKLYDAAIDEFLAGRPMKLDSGLPDVIKPLLRALENPANLPFSRELWAYSLPEHLAKVNEPMLVLIGKKDIQIDWKADGGPLEHATSQNSAVSFAYPDNPNHVLKHEELPREKLTAEYVGAHYNAPDTFLDREALDRIVSWLKEHM
ncbi:MAG: alpha/beta hydrolase family protein [Nitrososphaerales archaeon]